ncbi:MAG: LysR family transcriptional regulator [Peptococcaceae bacterium]|nr:LysR family transcriptional regulator [Peptococcaceae bacterium]
MRTEQLIYLNEIYRSPSLHQASENLHISVQALSLSVKNLEDELNMKILHRSHTGVSLTEQGKQLVALGNAFLADLSQLQASYPSNQQQSLTGILEIAATQGVIETLFPNLISQLFIDYPEFRLVPHPVTFTTISEALSDNCIECALFYRLSLNGELITLYNTNDFIFTPLSVGRYYCMVSDKFPISQHHSVSLKTMAKYPIILYSPTKDVLLNLFEHHSTTPNIILADSFQVFLQLLRGGNGLSVTYIPEASTMPIICAPNIKIIPFKENISSALGYLRRKKIPLSPKMQVFMSYVKEHIETNGLSNYPL